MSDWLPDLVMLSDHDGDWSAYLETIYRYFCTDFVESKPAYPDKRFAMKKHPMELGKEATFWHLISSGRVEENRQTDITRCERIRWPRPMIEAIKSESVRVWKNQRRGSNRILISTDDYSYLVVLDERKEFVLLWTAYCVQQPHRREKLRNECERWKAEAGNS